MTPKFSTANRSFEEPRVPAARILGGLAEGMSFEELCREYDVTTADIKAAVQYAEELVEQETHRYPLDPAR